ncbi:hypothetical protein C8J56DRAFT_1034146 [Mycena floridula]|nr:hypothetical protein C8J56DRAFT_1034146 [Mycena floridula]
MSSDSRKSSADPSCLWVENSPTAEEPDSSDLSATEKRWIWKAGDEITVKFLNRDQPDWDEVIEHAVKWTVAANLRLIFVSKNENALVRVQFNTDGRHRSREGTLCKLITDQSMPTIELGYTADTPVHERATQILHLFGHVLGFNHEHQHPHSVMHYGFKKEDSHLGLSPEDNQFAAECYPCKTDAAWLIPPVNSGQSMPPPSVWHRVAPSDSMQLGSGEATTLEMGHWYSPDGYSETLMSVSFSTPANGGGYGIFLGYNMLDIRGGSDHDQIRVRTDTRGGLSDFDLHSFTWDGSIMEAAGVSWLRVPYDHDFIDSGTHGDGVSGLDDRYRYNIYFGREYGAPPTVLMMIKTLNNKGNWRLSFYPNSITTQGFTANIETWGSSSILGFDFNWIAFPSDIKWIRWGEIWGTRNGGWARTITFKHSSPSPPKIFTGLSKYDTDSYLTFTFNISNITTTGFTYSIDAPRETLQNHLREIRGHYLALGI